MSTLDVVAEILREVAPRALNARQIVELARGRLPTASRTPETVVSRDLALEVKRNGTASRFLRAAPGEFLLKEALPITFYNDIDPYAAAWTRNLAAAGEIAAGVVDERSIRDLKPADVASYRQFHAFSGIGIWSRALRDAGFPDDANVWSGSCPCTDFSDAGRKRGFDGDFHLWPEWFRLIVACRPSCIVGEQVSSKAGRAWLDLVFNDLEGAGYTCRAFDTPACSVGAPHRRQRFYFVACARERAREILSASWLHTRALSDAAGARSRLAEDARADRGDEIASAETIERWAAGGLEFERGSAADDTGSVSDTECIVRDAGRVCGAHGWTAVEPDRHGEADGGVSGAVDRSLELGDAGLARGRRDAGEIPRAEGVGEGERIEARDLADEPLTPGADDVAVDRVGGGDAGAGGNGDVGEALVRGATALADIRPGDRIRIDGDPGWSGAVRGFWAVNVEWIYCRPEPGHEEGRWRPVESGNEPLVNGPAADLGRTRAKRLKGFGNALCLPLATTFVSAVLDAFVDASRQILAPVEDTVDEAPTLTKPLEGDTPPWTGPCSDEVAPSGMLLGRVPGDRWPYGPPSAHESRCNLHPHRGSLGGLFCDCAASAADDVAYGVGA